MSERRFEKRHLHFNLAHSPAGVRHTLHLGRRTFELEPHDGGSRAALRGLFEYIHNNDHLKDQLTHYHPEVEVSADTIQSYWISHPSPSGHPHPTLAGYGIMIPKAVAARAHGRLGHHRGLFSGKARHLGLVGPLPPPWLDHGDLADFVDFNDAAIYLVYHHSNLITLTSSRTESGSDTAAEIMAIIQSTPSFAIYDRHERLAGGLVWALKHQPEGFATAQPWLDKDGNPVCNSITHEPQWWWVPTPATLEAMKPVVQEALQVVNDQPHLDGVSFKIDHGRHSVTPVHAAASSPAEMALVTHPKPAISPHPPKTLAAAAPGGYSWQLGDPDYHHGRQIVLGKTIDRQITFTLNNSYFRHLCIFLRFLDQAGKPIPLKDIAVPDLGCGRTELKPGHWDTEYDLMVDWVSSRGRFMGIPTQDASSTERTVKLPDAAASMMILAGGMGTGRIEKTYWGVQTPGAILTAVFDLGLPTMFLAWGVAADELLTVCQGTVLGLVEWLLEAFVNDAVVAAIPSGDVSQSSLYTDWASAVLQAVITEGPGELLALLACAMELSAAEKALEWVPIAGQILYATNVAATMADLTETRTDVLLSPQIIPDLLTRTLNIDVNVKPDQEDYEFVASAVWMDITVMLTGSITYTATIKLEDQYPGYPEGWETLTWTFTNIPSGGQAQVDVKLRAKDGWEAATGSWSGPNLLNGQRAVQADIPLKEKVRPLTETTQYEHLHTLQYDSGTRQHIWVGTAPTETASDLGKIKLAGTESLDRLGGISINMTGHVGYSWSGMSPTLLPPGQASWSGAPEILSTAQVINVGVLHGEKKPDDGLRILVSGSNQAGYSLPVFLVEDLLGPADGLHFIVAPAVDPATGQSEYHAFRVALTGNSPIDLSTCRSWGRFASASLDAVCVHPRGFLLALNSQAEIVELLQLPSQPYEQLSDAVYATYTGGEGSYVGRLHGATAIAATKDGNAFLVLEAVNKRIQVFSVNGTSIPNYFPGGAPWIPLNLEIDERQEIDYLSMALEDTGFIYVLSSVHGTWDPQKYRLDVFEPPGKHLFRTTGVAAGQLTVDKFRVVYTENYQLIIGPNQRPEPGISKWIATGS